MILLEKFKKFIEEINLNNGRLYKQNILVNYKDDEDIKYLLHFIYNPYIVTGISTKKLERNVVLDEIKISFRATSTRSLLEYLKVHNTGRDEDIEVINAFKAIIHEDYIDLLNKIICKNIQIGVDAITINKMIPNLVPTFNVMLANSYFDHPATIEGKEFALTTKIDGGRIIAIKENNTVTFYTRSGQKYEGLVDLEKEMLEKMPNNLALDGEITLLNPGNLSSKEQYKETMKITRKLGEKHGVKMKVFDAMTAKDFKAQKCNQSYLTRRITLNTIFNNTFSYFEMLPILYQGSNIDQISNILNQQIQKGEEGIMINILDAPYEFKRTNNLLKVKKMQDIDLEIIGFEEGINRNQGKLGALLANYKGNVLKVGSGFSDQLREEIWKNKEDYLGLTMTVQYFEETSNADGEVSLRFPVFIDFRYDK